MLTIRSATTGDETQWRRLWAGYVDFYEASIPERVTAETWRRAISGEGDLFIRLAVLNGEVTGFTASVLHAGTWTLEPVCYLEDLYVAPEARGRGLGRHLIEDLIDLARSRNWSRLYWHTQAGNAAARALYDKFSAADDFVRYRLFL